ncbi:PREDICTED: E3 ubiquitin-protein ligase CHFR [Fragaria vesca subsp. vesca]|uniref:E3 ubiquitin-protein ligase CHFR n=1 Tax=Fragaria vesca subsp. vesca TaxID=101020 RepID=UPI0002C31F36|nr:PREDICTED: E3 ubiquitin-protein ligase CHFR [Fragaria vesca subsp. vesca]XP_011460939.1 PREDICTED: E3 ubiquitin-protein ligase CHFR [Fragaria vesca subsp. vesca]
MAEVGETSSAKPSGEIWAKLVPSDSRFPDVEIRDLVPTQDTLQSQDIGSDESLICSPVDNCEWCRITRNPDQSSATIQNKSSNAILVDGTVIQSEESTVIRSGSEIISGPAGEGCLSYRFNVLPGPETCQKTLKISVDAEHAKCCICLNIWHDAVTIAPCFHNFCNGCFSEWLRRSQEKRSSVLCPQCRGVVQFVGRNHFLHNIAGEIMNADSSLRRSNEETAVLDSYATVRSNLVIKSGKGLLGKRVRSAVQDEAETVELPCPQCSTQFGGFLCNRSTTHLQCQACGGMMPSRTLTSVPQHCIGCDRSFCGAYWYAQGVSQSASHCICIPDTFKPISERTISRIPTSAHENNRHEQEITTRCIAQMGRTLQDVIAEWMTMFNNRTIDRTNRMPLKNAELITSGTYTCSDCYEKLISFLLYWFRVSVSVSHLPPDASKRDNCWYGYACRTQHHNEDHARKRNHVCRPTRGANV